MQSFLSFASCMGLETGGALDFAATPHTFSRTHAATAVSDVHWNGPVRMLASRPLSAFCFFTFTRRRWFYLQPTHVTLRSISSQPGSCGVCAPRSRIPTLSPFQERVEAVRWLQRAGGRGVESIIVDFGFGWTKGMRTGSHKAGQLLIMSSKLEARPSWSLGPSCMEKRRCHYTFYSFSDSRTAILATQSTLFASATPAHIPLLLLSHFTHIFHRALILGTAIRLPAKHDLARG